MRSCLFVISVGLFNGTYNLHKEQPCSTCPTPAAARILRLRTCRQRPLRRSDQSAWCHLWTVPRFHASLSSILRFSTSRRIRNGRPLIISALLVRLRKTFNTPVLKIIFLLLSLWFLGRQNHQTVWSFLWCEESDRATPRCSPWTAAGHSSAFSGKTCSLRRCALFNCCVCLGFDPDGLFSFLVPRLPSLSFVIRCTIMWDSSTTFSQPECSRFFLREA